MLEIPSGCRMLGVELLVLLPDEAALPVLVPSAHCNWPPPTAHECCHPSSSSVPIPITTTTTTTTATGSSTPLGTQECPPPASASLLVGALDQMGCDPCAGSGQASLESSKGGTELQVPGGRKADGRADSHVGMGRGSNNGGGGVGRGPHGHNLASGSVQEVPSSQHLLREDTVREAAKVASLNGDAGKGTGDSAVHKPAAGLPPAAASLAMVPSNPNTLPSQSSSNSTSLGKPLAPPDSSLSGPGVADGSLGTSGGEVGVEEVCQYIDRVLLPSVDIRRSASTLRSDYAYIVAQVR